MHVGAQADQAYSIAFLRRHGAEIEPVDDEG